MLRDAGNRSIWMLLQSGLTPWMFGTQEAGFDYAFGVRKATRWTQKEEYGRALRIVKQVWGRLRPGALGSLLWLRAVANATGRRTTDPPSNKAPRDITHRILRPSEGMHTRAGRWLPMGSSAEYSYAGCAARTTVQDRALYRRHDDQQRIAQGAPGFFFLV